MEFLQHTATGMTMQKLHSPYSVRNKKIYKHCVPLFPFTHPTHAIISCIFAIKLFSMESVKNKSVQACGTCTGLLKSKIIIQ